MSVLYMGSAQLEEKDAFSDALIFISWMLSAERFAASVLSTSMLISPTCVHGLYVWMRACSRQCASVFSVACRLMHWSVSERMWLTGYSSLRSPWKVISNWFGIVIWGLVAANEIYFCKILLNAWHGYDVFGARVARLAFPVLHDVPDTSVPVEARCSWLADKLLHAVRTIRRCCSDIFISICLLLGSQGNAG